MESVIPRYFKPDRKPGRPSKKYRQSVPSDVRNPEREQENRRRAEKLGSAGTYTLKQWLELIAEHGNKCLRCLRFDLKLTADHVVPLVKGGSNDISNIQPLCGRCNSSKGARIIDYRPGFAFEIL